MPSPEASYCSEDPIAEIHRYGLDLQFDQIYLMGSDEYISHEMEDEPGIEFSMAGHFIKNLNILMSRNTDPILIHMKTCGGYWEEGMAIYDAIASCPNKTTILNYNHARSMSSIIFQAANKRVMMPHSTFMFHEGDVAFSGTPKMLRSFHSQEAVALDIMLDIYAESMKKKGKMSKSRPDTIRRWLVTQMDKKEDVFLSAKEAVEYGFADEVFGANGKYDRKALTVFDKEKD